MESVKKVIFLLLFFALQLTLYSQLKPVYDFWKDDSLVKKKYYEQALQKQNSLIASLGKENKEDYKDIYKIRFEQVAQTLQSSRTVTAPEVHQYLQEILKQIVDVNEELKPLHIRMVFSRDAWPNAYSMGEGTLMVNAGLMVFLDNESELVFVLCHELAHLYLDHSEKTIKKNVTKFNSDEFKNEIKRLSKEQYRVGRN